MNFKNIATSFLVCQFFFIDATAQQLNNNGFTVTQNNVTVHVVFITDNIVRICKLPEGKSTLQKSLVVKELQPKHGKITVSDNVNETKASGKMLQVVFNKKTNAISYYRNNKLLLSEAVNAAELTPANDDGKPAFAIAQGFAFQNDEALYGFGQSQNGKMNQRHEEILLRQRNMEIAIPFFQSIKGYGIYWDNYSVTKYLPETNSAEIFSEIGDCIDYYFMAGDNADDVIRQFRHLTGEVPMLPLWSFGFMQSKERYRSQYELVDVVKKYRKLQVPLDVVIQDWQYWGESDSSWNAIQFNNPGFPEPKKAIDSIHEMNAKVLISVWPSFGAGTDIYKEMDKNGMLFNFYTFPVKDYVKVFDAFNPKAREIYWNYMKKNLFALGIDGWWLDATEPVQKNVSKNLDRKTNEHEISVKDLLTSIDNVPTHIGSFKRYTNLYPLQTVNSIYDGQRALTSNKRTYILTRSAFAGQQKTASVVWSGDVTSSWEVLKAQIPAALNLTLSGMPYWNSDIGGFFAARKYPKGVKDLAYQELYIRWAQMAVFTAMMRSHGTNTPREIWQFGKKGDIAYDIIEKYIRLRYQLQPYIYSASWDVTNKNASLMRPLLMDYPNDKKNWDNNNSFLFGKNILVNPVTDSIYPVPVTAFDAVSAVNLQTYLPAGVWYNFWDDRRYNGTTTVMQKATLSDMPVFVKAGTILPLADVPQFSSIKNFKHLTVKIYPGKNGSFELYEDEGDNYNYEKGKYSLIRFVWDDKARMLTINKRMGDFAGMESLRNFTIIIAGTGKTKTITYNGGQQTIKL